MSFGNWVNNPEEVKQLICAINNGDVETATELGEDLFESYLDVAAALTSEYIIKYANMMGDELSSVSSDVDCWGEFMDHEHPDYIDDACQRSIEVGIPFSYYCYFNYYWSGTNSHSEFDPDPIDSYFKQLLEKGIMSSTEYFTILSSLGESVTIDNNYVDYLEIILKNADINLNEMSDKAFAQALYLCHACYPITPNLFKLFISKANGRKVSDLIDLGAVFLYFSTYEDDFDDNEECLKLACIELKHTGIITNIEALAQMMEDEGRESLSQALLHG